MCLPCENVSQSLQSDFTFLYMLCENVFLKMEGIAHVKGIVLEVPGGRRVGSTQVQEKSSWV